MEEVAKAKKRASKPTLGYKNQYWFPLSDHTTCEGILLCRGLYHYIGLGDYESWRNLLGACSLSKASFRSPVWQNEIGVSIFSYPSGHGSKGNTCRSNQWIALGRSTKSQYFLHQPSNMSSHVNGGWYCSVLLMLQGVELDSQPGCRVVCRVVMCAVVVT